MGEVISMPLRIDLDVVGSYAALTVMSVELARAAMRDDVDEVLIVLNGERRTLDRDAALKIAEDMLRQREELADANPALAAKVAGAQTTMTTAETMLDDGRDDG
jgi:hypothetical protein